MHLQITFEFDLALYRVDRNVYSIIEWVGDVGGLNEGLLIVCSGILAILNFNRFNHFMAERLFRKTPGPMGAIKHLSDGKTRVWRQKLNDSCSCCQRLFCLKICRLNREERLFAKARV